MEPFFFREGSNQLYGIYHQACNDESNIGIVICNPFGYEYMRAHRPLALLANKLAMKGFDILRFDYYGCGDSSGDLNNATLNYWINDINCSIETLRSSKNFKHICLIGNRLGASLAFETAVNRNDIEKLVLWDPIINGSEYLTELSQTHEKWLTQSFSTNNTFKTEHEYMGFEMSEKLLADINQLDLLRQKKEIKNKVQFICQNPVDSSLKFKKMLEEIVSDFQYINSPGNYSWEKQTDNQNNQIVPNNILNFITEWIG